ncbi:NAD(P)H-binding protein [Streptomyces diastatochromogenes]|nr:NAD(P)H-binding protein [Streptomyces diastatochromogenes]
MVLGAAGFVGSAVLRELARHPIRLRAVSRRHTPAHDARADIEVVAADLTRPGQMAAAVAGADVVIHSWPTSRAPPPGASPTATPSPNASTSA